MQLKLLICPSSLINFTTFIQVWELLQNHPDADAKVTQINLDADGQVAAIGSSELIVSF